MRGVIYPVVFWAYNLPLSLAISGWGEDSVIRTVPPQRGKVFLLSEGEERMLNELLRIVSILGEGWALEILILDKTTLTG